MPAAIMIYLDNNATTPPDPAVVEAMLPWLGARFANPSAGHAAGRRGRRALEEARGQVAALLGAEPDEITFTSGATEAINWAHLSVQAAQSARPLLVTSTMEHAAGLECAARWAQMGGEVRLASVDASGNLDLNAFQAALEPGRTALVSLIWANNETGVLLRMEEAVHLAHEAGALVHVDAVQAVGKIPVRVRELGADYLSVSSHKLHGPQGVGALWAARHAPLTPWLLGGGQEQGRRSGTENLPGIVGFGRAAELAAGHAHEAGMVAIAALRDALEARLLAAWPGLQIHGADTARLPNTSSLCFPGLDAAGLLILLDQKGLACSGGSACHAGAVHPSHVLEAMGFDAAHAASTLRFSWSRQNTFEEVEAAAKLILAALKKLEGLQNADVGPVLVGG